MLPLTRPDAPTMYEATPPTGQRRNHPPMGADTSESDTQQFQRVGVTLKPAQQVNTFLDWMQEVGVDRFDLALIRFAQDPQGVFIPGSVQLDRAGVVKSLPWLRYENSRGAGVYIRPARGNAWPILFLDDVSPEAAHGLANRHACVLVETSLDLFHVWLATDREMGERERYENQSSLAKKVGADSGSLSGEHWGRLPGFTNRKPGKESVWVNLRRVTDGDAFLTRNDAPAFCPVRGSGLALVNPVSNKQLSAATETDIDESAMEWKFVRSALEAGVPPNIVHLRLLERCANRRGSDARRYAELTMRKACAKGGFVFR